MGRFLVAPSILSADFANLQTEIDKITAAGADWIHVDVMDGHFVPNLTIGAPVVAAVRKVTKLTLDVHLMIENPENYVDSFLAAGSDCLTIHVEATEDPGRILKRIRAQGKRAGLTLRPGTSIDRIIPHLEDCDLVLVMTVEPGFGGQSFLQDQTAKIKRLRDEINKRGLATLIEVDGGINDRTKLQCVGADVLVAGNFVFKHPAGYQAAIEALR